MSRPSTRVFLSCVTAEFEAATAAFPGFRGRLRHLLARANLEVTVQEDLPLNDADTVLKMADIIRSCHAVIHLVGAEAGTVAHPKAVAEFLATALDFLAGHPDLRATLGDCRDLTYTQWEAYLALHYGVSLRVYATTPGAEAQAAHLEHLKLAQRYASLFRDEAHLLGQLIGDLSYILSAPSGGLPTVGRGNTASGNPGGDFDILDGLSRESTRLVELVALRDRVARLPDAVADLRGRLTKSVLAAGQPRDALFLARGVALDLLKTVVATAGQLPPDEFLKLARKNALEGRYRELMPAEIVSHLTHVVEVGTKAGPTAADVPEVLTQLLGVVEWYATEFEREPDEGDETAWFQPGERLGAYEIVARSGVGSFSFNLAVRDLAGRPFHAVVHRRRDRQAETLEGLRLEAPLRHPALPAIVFIGEPCPASRGRSWFVREPTPPPLGDVVRTSGQPRPVAEVCAVGLAVCRLLDYLHDATRHPAAGRLVHGFLVPGYLHLLPGEDGKGGAVKVAGLDVQILVRAGHPVPDFHRSFRAPDCVDAAPDALTPENDVWALAGCLLYLATGRGPTDPGDADSIRAAHATDVPLRRASEVPDAGLRAALVRAFVPDPEGRFRTPADLRRALEAALVPPEPPDGLTAGYPAPIAAAYRRVLDANDSADRLHWYTALIDTSVKYLAFVGLADLLHCRTAAGQPPFPEAEVFAFTRRRERASLGGWVQVVRAVARELATFPGRFVAEFPAVCQPGSRLDLLLSGDLVRWWNDATNESDSSADVKRRQVVEALPVVKQLVSELAFLCRYPLAYVSRGRLHPCGDAPASAATELPPSADLPEGIPFISAPDGTSVLGLWPFVLLREAEPPRSPELYLFHQLDRAGVYLDHVVALGIGLQSDWSFQLCRYEPADFTWLTERLRQFPPRLAVPAELRLAERLRGEAIAPPPTAPTLPDDAENPFAPTTEGSTFLDWHGGARRAMEALDSHNWVLVLGSLQSEKTGLVHELLRRCITRWGARTAVLDLNDIPPGELVPQFADVFSLPTGRVNVFTTMEYTRRVPIVVALLGVHLLCEPGYAEQLAGFLVDLVRHDRGGNLRLIFTTRSHISPNVADGTHADAFARLLATQQTVVIPDGFYDREMLTPDHVGRYLDDRLQGRSVRFTADERRQLYTACEGRLDTLLTLAHALYERRRAATAGPRTWHVGLAVRAPKPLLVGQAVAVEVRFDPTAGPDTTPLRVPDGVLELTLFADAPKFHLDGDYARTIPVVRGRPTPRTAVFELLAVTSGEHRVAVSVHPGPRADGGEPAGVEVTVRVEPPAAAAGREAGRVQVPAPLPDAVLRAWLTETTRGEELEYTLTCAALGWADQTFPSVPTAAADLAALRRDAALAGRAASAGGADEFTALRHFGAALLDRLAPPGCEFRAALLALYRAARGTKRRWSLLVVSGAEAAAPWELACPPAADVPFFAQVFDVGHWVGRRGLPIPAGVPFDRVGLAHYGRDAAAVALCRDDLGGAELVYDEVPDAESAVTRPGPCYGLHLLREATARTAGTVTRYGRPEPADAEEAPHVRHRLDFTLKQPVVGVSVTETRPASDPGGADETDTRLGPVWAAGFLQVGASAVVGPWWPVPAGADAVFARTFYAAVRDGVPLGAAAGRAREAVRAAYPHQPHWLAMALFGHPAARPYPVEEVDGFTLFEALDTPADGRFVPGVSYRFRASYRSEQPVWYEGPQRLAPPAPGWPRVAEPVVPRDAAGGDRPSATFDGAGVVVLVVPLTGGEPVEAELTRRGRAWAADVALTAPAGAWLLAAKFYRGDEELRTVFLKPTAAEEVVYE